MTFWQLFVADLKSLIRNRMALFWFLVFPVIFILIFGAVFSGNQQASFEIGLVCPPGDPLAAAIQRGFAQVQAFHVHNGTLEAELAAMKVGHRALVVEVPDGAAARAAAGGKVEVSVYYEKGREQTGMMLFSSVSQILDEVERTLAGPTTAAGGQARRLRRRRRSSTSTSCCRASWPWRSCSSASSVRSRWSACASRRS